MKNQFLWVQRFWCWICSIFNLIQLDISGQLPHRPSIENFLPSLEDGKFVERTRESRKRLFRHFCSDTEFSLGWKAQNELLKMIIGQNEANPVVQSSHPVSNISEKQQSGSNLASSASSVSETDKQSPWRTTSQDKFRAMSGWELAAKTDSSRTKAAHPKWAQIWKCSWVAPWKRQCSKLANLAALQLEMEHAKRRKNPWKFYPKDCLQFWMKLRRL